MLASPAEGASGNRVRLAAWFGLMHAFASRGQEPEFRMSYVNLFVVCL
jgi:hypothetical protein